jgi:transcriptional regulator GlxA family with amidase domain
MNENSLKRGFKAVFGETVLDFSIRCRMQFALMLLRIQRLPVARVAEAVGTAAKAHFPLLSAGRHFGIRPKDVPRNPHR